MKKKELSKLALLGLATGVLMTSAVDVSANVVVETKGTYLAGNCGGGSCSGYKPKTNNNNNNTADTFTPTSNQVVNPNMAPKPESLHTNPVNNSQYNNQNPYNNQNQYSNQNQYRQQNAQPFQGNYQGQQGMNEQRNSAGNPAYNQNQMQPQQSYNQPSGGCREGIPSNGQTSNACHAKNNYRR